MINKEMKKDDWIAKIVEYLNLENKEEFIEFLNKKFQVKFDNNNVENILKPEIEIDDEGVMLKYDVEGYLENYLLYQNADNAIQKLFNIELHSCHQPNIVDLDGNVIIRLVIINWDKLEYLIQKFQS